MATSFTHIVPILAALIAGYVLRWRRIAQRSDGEFLFKVVFYLCVPAVSFYSLAVVDITRHLLLFPLMCAITTAVALLIAKVVAHEEHLDRARYTTFLLLATITNSLFVLAFSQALFGAEGTARVAAYDVANVILIYGGMYAVAARANPDHQGGNMLARKLFSSPPLYGVFAGLVVNLAGWHLPVTITNVANTFGAATGFLVTLAIGIMFTPQRDDLRIGITALIVRFASGLLVGLAVIGAFHLEGADRTVVLLLALAPCGFNAVTFASLEKLDVPLAASTLSMSLVLAVVLATGVSLFLS